MENKNNTPNPFSIQEAMRLANSPEGKQLIALLRQQNGSDLQNAMNRASAGDYAQAKKMIESMLSDPDAQKLLKQLGR